MGRGKGDEAAAPVTRRQGPGDQGAHDRTVDILGFGRLMRSGGGAKASSSKLVRDLGARTFVDDVEEFRAQEGAFLDGVRETLNEAMRDFVQSGQWGDFLRICAQSPDYSFGNNVWAWGQMRKRWEDMEERGDATHDEAEAMLGGRFFSASAARAMGARVKSGFFYTPKDGFDGRYLVEMLKPLGFEGYYKDDAVLDSSGRPVMTSSGEPKTKKVFVPLRPKGFGVFHAYHQDALEMVEKVTDPETGEKGEVVRPFAVPDAPWKDATGSEEDAARLMTDLERICQEEGLSVGRSESLRAFGTAEMPERSRLDRASRTITIDVHSGMPEQAVALLRALCEHVGHDDEPKDEDARRLRRAAEESAKYAVASLYGLESKDQTFPHLIEIADNEKELARVVSDTHRRMQRILSHLDPVMRAKAHAAGARRQASGSKRKGKSTKARAKAK
jgi:hypothetical protein